jgi:hypothetical protein
MSLAPDFPLHARLSGENFAADKWRNRLPCFVLAGFGLAWPSDPGAALPTDRLLVDARAM